MSPILQERKYDPFLSMSIINVIIIIINIIIIRYLRVMRALVLKRMVSALLVGLVNLAKTMPAMQAWNTENEIIDRDDVHIPAKNNFPLSNLGSPNVMPGYCEPAAINVYIKRIYYFSRMYFHPYTYTHPLTNAMLAKIVSNKQVMIVNPHQAQKYVQHT